MLPPVRNRDHREHQQRRDLDDINRQIHACRAGDASVSDVRHAEREHDTEQDHEQRAVVATRERVRPELIQQIAAEDGRDADHTARIDPVIQVTRPAGHELRQPRELEGLGFRHERLLGVVIR